MLFRGYVALRFPTRDINSPAAAGVNCQEEGRCRYGHSEAEGEIFALERRVFVYNNLLAIAELSAREPP